jgi:FKBP-type peptidyl-prolyl cis-trans isomerase
MMARSDGDDTIMMIATRHRARSISSLLPHTPIMTSILMMRFTLLMALIVTDCHAFVHLTKTHASTSHARQHDDDISKDRLLLCRFAKHLMMAAQQPQQQQEDTIIDRNISRRNMMLLSTTTTTLSSILFLPDHDALAKDLKEDYRQGTAALADDMSSMAPVPREAYKKLDSGVIYADLRPGGSSDAVATTNSRVNLQWVLRKSNGYFVDSSANQNGVPFIFTIGDGTAIQGVDEGIRGMKVGGVRRLLIPPSLAYVEGLEDGKPGPLPNGFGPKQQMRRVQKIRKDVPGEYVYLEVQLTRMR